MKRSYLDANRALLARFLKATIEGNYLALSDEARAKDVLAKETKTTDAKIVAITYNEFRQQTPVNAEPTRCGAENIIAQFPEGVSCDVDDYVDASILDRLKREGFFASLEQKYGRR